MLLRVEHWIIRTLKFDRMSNNLIWLTVALLPLIAGLIWWLLQLHEKPDTEFILLRDPAFSGEVAEVSYTEGEFYITPRIERILLNFKPISATTRIREDDQLVLGHLIFQVKQLDGWTPHLQIIGYYAADRDLSDGLSVGRSIHPEELNNWERNDIVVQDSSVEPVHFTIAPAQKPFYRIKVAGQKGVYVPAPSVTDAQSSGSQQEERPQWLHILTETTIAAGQQIVAGNSIFELIPLDELEALALKIVRGVRPTYKLSREARNVIGGLRMIPKTYIPDYLVDEEFIEYVRQAIEQALFYLDDTQPILRVKGFDAAGKLVKQDFDALSDKEKFLLHRIFRFREEEGTALRWRRPFNREAEDAYQFYPGYIENFIINTKTRQVRNIYRYAAHLTNPHTIAEEMATERGEIFDRDRFSYARLWMYADPAVPLAELLLVPSSNPETVLKFNTRKEPDTIVYVAGGYRFSGGTSVLYDDEKGTFLWISGGTAAPLQNGATFTDGEYTFRYTAPGNGALAQNLEQGQTSRRYYPLGRRLAHIIGYSYAKSQFKGNLEKVFDRVLLGREKQQPWWSLERTIERVPGNNLILTIDDDLQRVVYAELKKKLDVLNNRYKTGQFKGAAIVISREGEILASTSIPAYNPNDIHDILRSLKESSEDHWNSSYINRATHKSYPPGSTMKVIMSTIVLNHKDHFLLPTGDGQYMIKNEYGRYFTCTGRLSSFRGASFGKYGIPDFGGSSHGTLTLDKALTVSCNNTFAFLALSAGHKTIQAYAESYGFNQQFDFLPYQMFKDDISLVSNINRDVRDPLASLASQVPDPKDELKLSQLARMGIGQWEILATPLQMATVAMTVGNLGYRPYPHLVEGIEDQTTGETRYLPYPEKEHVLLSEPLRELFPMMLHVVQEGSARRITGSRIPYYTLKDHVAGKTGTAEVEDWELNKRFNVVWFISFAPVENPQMAIAVVIEKGPLVSGEAVEVARGIWEKAVLLYPHLFPVIESQE